MANVINEFLSKAKDVTDTAVRKKDELYMPEMLCKEQDRFRLLQQMRHKAGCNRRSG